MYGHRYEYQDALAPFRALGDAIRNGDVIRSNGQLIRANGRYFNYGYNFTPISNGYVYESPSYGYGYAPPSDGYAPSNYGY